MADISDKVYIRGANGAATRPFGWHVWNVRVPANILTVGGVDDIVLPDRFQIDSRITSLNTQVVNNGVSATTLIIDVEMGLRAISTGVISSLSNMQVGQDLELLGQEGVLVPFGGTNVFNGFGSAVTAGTNERIINLEITNTGTPAGTEVEFDVYALIGRNAY
jgi:hypothetical protein